MAYIKDLHFNFILDINFNYFIFTFKYTVAQSF